MKATVHLEDGSADIEFVDCVAYTMGEFSGNIDCAVRCGPELSIEEIAGHLKLNVPGEREMVDLLGSGSVHGGYDLTFHSPVVDGARTPPAQVEAFWVGPGRQRLARLECVAGD